MLTGFQIRAARAGLNMTAKELAERAGVSLPTIQRFESVEGVPPSRSSKLLDVKAALEAAGIEFIGTPEDRPGIRMRSKT
jgi:DNA-binding transcriptional regulator YiaG